MNNMADDDDSFVTIGTAFDVPEEDAPKKKAVLIHEQIATDNEGRRRFHGAFTGGFSAGYFNTVGSKEGWQPASFVSSRSKRFESSRQKPEDFMDEDDFSEFGIAPRNVKTTKLFSVETGGDSEKSSAAPTHSASLNSMVRSALEELVVPCRMSIGVKLLKKMGWKEGQGIGPRVRQVPKKKVYGCVLPPGRPGHEQENDEHDMYAEGLLFAPKDTKPFIFVPKDNLHGIGYRGLAAPVTPINIPKPGYSGNLKIKGQAFGIGAFEEDDEDVYTEDSIANYDIDLNDRKPRSDPGWTGPPGYSEKGGALSNFSLASKPRSANKVFPPPVIPKGYQPLSNVKETLGNRPDTSEKEKRTSGHLTSDERAQLLGEAPLPKPVKSVFDLMSKSDRDRLKPVDSAKENSSAPCGPRALSRPLLPQQSSPLGSRGFQPFAKNPAKQARYETFLESKKSGKEVVVPTELCTGLTEWEREREKEEFARAANLFQPLKGTIASRFIRASNLGDDHDENYRVSSENESVAEKAVEMKMFGKLTRSTFEWHPAKLLCKRFNIPEPYPSSKTVGLVHDKKERFNLGQFFASSRKDSGQLAGETDASGSTSAQKVSAMEVQATESKSDIETKKQEEILLTTAVSGDAVSASNPEEERSKGKPSMDLFKAIFASSSEDESEKSESEDENGDDIKETGPSSSEISKPDLGELSNKEKNLENRSLSVTISCSDVSEGTSQSMMVLGQNNMQQNDMEVDEPQYGPKPPPPPPEQPGKTGGFKKLEFMPRHAVPFSDPVSESESDDDRDKTKKKHKLKHKHKRKHKHKHRQQEKEKSGKRHDREKSKISCDLDPNEIDRKKQTGLLDDKEILSKLKAVQKRRMCAADFM